MAVFSTEFSRYLYREIAVAFVFNWIINSYIAWSIFGSRDQVSISGLDGFGMDILVSSFLFFVITTLVVVPITCSRAKKGVLSLNNIYQFLDKYYYFNYLPKSLFVLSLFLGFLGVLIVAPITLSVFYFSGHEVIDPQYFSLIKGFWAAILSALLVALLTIVGLVKHSQGMISS